MSVKLTNPITQALSGNPAAALELASLSQSQRQVMGMIACPTCKGNLQLEAGEETGDETSGEQLCCPRCSVTYQSRDGIPNLLPPLSRKECALPDTGLTADQVKRYYIDFERYDWITDTRYPEKMLHVLREREIVKCLQEHGRGGTALDIGCGTGLITRHLGFDCVLGLDINRWAIERAKSHVNGNVRFVMGDAEDMPLATAVFDTAVCTDVLEHLPDPGKALRNIRRVMKPEATLIGMVPSKSPVWKLRKFITTSCPASEPFHHNYSVDELRALLADFRIVKICHSVLGLEVLFIARGSAESS